MSEQIHGSPLVPRLRGFGSNIFAEMSALATAEGAINLGQGFPDTDGPAEVLEAAVDAIHEGHNQYPPVRGIPVLREAIATHQRNRYGLTWDLETEIVVTAGANEAMTATILATCESGDEVLLIEPAFDSYWVAIAMAGAKPVAVPLTGPDQRVDVERLAASVTDRTRLIIVNSPHNPSGRVFDADELEGIATIARERDLLVVTDEVYEHLTFDDAVHLPIATLPGMRERTISISSAGKTFSVTGWKIGWACAPAPLVQAVQTVKQFMTFVNGAPFQYAIARGLLLPPERFEQIRADLQRGRDLLVPGLQAAGLQVLPSQGTYFVTADISPLGETDGHEFCRSLPRRCGVAAVPSQVFYADPYPRPLVRFAVCKQPEVLAEAADRLAGLNLPT
ncbi:pyridoxal phosphate-dependent aminotransferase [Naumannella halotolerans]|uniref:N-succinyldiaminopimelate aminotransferase n=1 Tax=Naumannella halotolerans TaxID=993414 RepID=A0A4R7JAQ3_9ACTN|nr:pyridoxal phosphate-dependent aminotransferase [Naumannella halotolerans]TDT33479.1 N-succinyldiaminopimelate aminotransferase [Naumannella halotolerans]